MGQINSNPDLEGSPDKLISTLGETSESAEDSPSKSKSEKSNKDKKLQNDSIQCVKTRIDMLIEDCLNIKDFSDDSNEKTIKVNGDMLLNNSESFGLSPEKCKTPETIAKIGNKSGRSPQSNVNMSNENSPPVSVKNENNSAVSETACADEIKFQSDGGKCEQEKKSDEKFVLKMSDLISEMTTNQIIQQQKKSITTFQTFIDKVLDTSLKEPDEEDENKPKNILHLCNESLLPSQKSEPKLTEKHNNSTSGSIKSESDKKCAKIKPEGKITLKDHIERFLEMSFRAEEQDENNLEHDKKKDVYNSKNSVPENFNAQGLVNNMITQGLQINKLLSPPINRSKDPQKSPNIRPRSSFDKDCFSQKPVKAEEQQINNMRTPEHVPMRGSYHETNKNELQNNSGSHRDMGSRSSHAGNYGHQNSNPGPPHSTGPSPKVYPPYISLPVGDRREMREVRNDARDFKDSSEVHFMETRHQEQRAEQMYRGTQGDPSYDRKDLPSKFYLQQQMLGASHPHRPEPYITHHSPEQASAIYRSQPSPRSATMSYHPAAPSQEQRSPGRPNKPSLDSRECTWPLSMPHLRQQLDIPEEKSIEHHRQRSPNVPPMLSPEMAALQARGHLPEQAAVMMRPTHSALPPGFVAYPTMPQLLPHHPPITSSKEYSATQLLSPGMYQMKGAQGRRSSLHDSQGQGPYYYSQRSEEYLPNEHADQYHTAAERVSPRNPYPVRPASLPSQDHSPDRMYFVRRVSGPTTEVSTNNDSSSRISDSLSEAPLDLSCKKPKQEPERPRSSSYSSTFQGSTTQRKINPSNTFLKHLENSVDKYCQELNSPSSPPTLNKLLRQQHSTAPPNDKGTILGFSRQSPRDPSPHNQFNMLHNRTLPSPHYSGGITLGQPLVDNKAHAMQPPIEFQYNRAPPTNPAAQTQSFMQQTSCHSPMVTTAQSNFDMNAKRNINNISKHEPIQNIIGNHDPNDILYLICRLCTQTYGSPYGFRKHFRNQHGFEPRAEHTIVQTISATKSALHGSMGPMQSSVSLQSTPEVADTNNTAASPALKPDFKESFVSQGKLLNSDRNSRSASASPIEARSKSNGSSEDGERMIGQKKLLEFETETKCLECPNCGKTFQLNDFGSYKRHCRQHGNLRLNGPYTCSDCHLSFPDQKTLKEHYIGHVQESQTPHLGNIKTEETESKPVNHQTCFSCVKCDKQFENITSYKSHMDSHEQPPKLSPKVEPGSSANERSTSKTVENKDKKSPKSWRDDMMLNVIPSRTIVRQAAESNTSLACPDSSWDVDKTRAVSMDDKGDEVTTENSDKGDEIATENSDSGYSSSVGSNSALLTEDKFGEKSEISPADQLSLQKSVDSNSETNDNKNAGDNADMYYKHKKFFLHRKRENSISSQSSLSNDGTPSKQMKMSSTPPVPASSSSPAASISTVSSTFTATELCDSSICTAPADSDSTENVKAKNNVVADNCLKMKGSPVTPVDKIPKECLLSQPEARHNLPFVCDRTRRGQRKAVV